MLIQDSSALRSYCSNHKTESPICFDTEFVRERTYYPRLEVVQLLVGGETAIIDCQAVDNLDPLWDLLCNPESEKVVHSGLQDMEMIYLACGKLPAPIFDTQIAASLLGMGSQCGYSKLVQQLLGIRIRKSETFSDWTHRPLNQSQIDYARADVQHLLRVHDVLVKQLEKKGRLHWMQEECEFLTSEETFQKLSPENSFLKIKGRSGLDPRSLTVLQALAEWREYEARKRNVLPGRVIGDHVLLAMAQAAPTDMDHLKRQRGLHSGEINRHGETLLGLIKQALEKAKTDPIQLPPQNGYRTDEEDDSVSRILVAVVQILAEKAEIAPTILATRDDLRSLVNGYRNGRLNGIPLLRGWRKDIVGDKLLSVLAGNISIRINPDKGNVELCKAEHLDE